MEAIFNISNKDDFERITEDILGCLLDEHQGETTNTLGVNNFNTAKEAVKNILNETNCDTEKINQVLSEKGFNKEHIIIFCSKVENRKNSILLLLLLQHNSLFGETVVTFDWLIKLVCGTSELKKMRYPLLQLALTTTNSKQIQTHTSYDISKDVLIKFINILENI